MIGGPKDRHNVRENHQSMSCWLIILTNSVVLIHIILTFSANFETL